MSIFRLCPNEVNLPQQPSSRRTATTQRTILRRPASPLTVPLRESSRETYDPSLFLPPYQCIALASWLRGTKRQSFRNERLERARRWQVTQQETPLKIICLHQTTQSSSSSIISRWWRTR